MSQTLKGTCVLPTMQSAICTDLDFFGGGGLILLLWNNLLFLVVEITIHPYSEYISISMLYFFGGGGSVLHNYLKPLFYVVILFLFVPWYGQIICELVSDVVLILNNFPLNFLILLIYLGSDFISMLNKLLYSWKHLDKLLSVSWAKLTSKFISLFPICYAPLSVVTWF